jgi:hypothetical protein
MASIANKPTMNPDYLNVTPTPLKRRLGAIVFDFMASCMPIARGIVCMSFIIAAMLSIFTSDWRDAWRFALFAVIICPVWDKP